MTEQNAIRIEIRVTAPAGSTATQAHPYRVVPLVWSASPGWTPGAEEDEQEIPADPEEPADWQEVPNPPQSITERKFVTFPIRVRPEELDTESTFSLHDSALSEARRLSAEEVARYTFSDGSVLDTGLDAPVRHAEEQEARLDQALSAAVGLAEKRDEQEAENDRLRRERDAAVADLRAAQQPQAVGVEAAAVAMVPELRRQIDDLRDELAEAQRRYLDAVYARGEAVKRGEAAVRSARVDEIRRQRALAELSAAREEIAGLRAAHARVEALIAQWKTDNGIAEPAAPPAPEEEPHTLTEEELDALPEDSIVEDFEGERYTRDRFGEWEGSGDAGMQPSANLANWNPVLVESEGQS